MKLILPCLTSFLITAIVMPFVIRLATARECLDDPGGRRLHAQPTPRLGGVAFFAGVLPMLVSGTDGRTMGAILGASTILVILGVIDDLTPLGWKAKFTGMILATTIVIFAGGITVSRVPFSPFSEQLELGWFSIPFTCLCLIGMTNAINLLDGLDGLAGGVSLLGFLFMGIAALLTGNTALAVVCCAYVGALTAFLMFNFPRARVFMGDSGSLFLGFSLAVTAVQLTGNVSAPVHTLFPVLLLLLPVFDTLRVLVKRVANGANPFKADNLHLHYLMMQRYKSPLAVTLLFWGSTTVLGCLGLILGTASTLMYLAVMVTVSLLLGTYVAGLHIKPELTGSGYAGFTVPDTVTWRTMWGAVLGVLLLPAQSLAVTDCWFREYQDHYVAVCSGDEPHTPEHAKAGVITHPPLPFPQQVHVVTETSSGSAPAASVAVSSSLRSAPRHPGSQDTVHQPAAGSVPVPQLPPGPAEVIPSMYRAPRSMLHQQNNIPAQRQAQPQEVTNVQ